MRSYFQVHGVDASGNAVLRRKLARRGLIAFFTKQPPCLVSMEACSSAHHWARELVRLVTNNSREIVDAARPSFEQSRAPRRSVHAELPAPRCNQFQSLRSSSRRTAFGRPGDLNPSRGIRSERRI